MWPMIGALTASGWAPAPASLERVGDCVVFHDPPEDPEEPQIARQMHQAAVPEHGGEEVGEATGQMPGQLNGDKARELDGFLNANLILPAEIDPEVGGDKRKRGERKAPDAVSSESGISAGCPTSSLVSEAGGNQKSPPPASVAGKISGNRSSSGLRTCHLEAGSKSPQHEDQESRGDDGNDHRSDAPKAAAEESEHHDPIGAPRGSCSPDKTNQPTNPLSRE